MNIKIKEINGHKVVRSYQKIGIYKVVTSTGEFKHFDKEGKLLMDDKELLTRLQSIGDTLSEVRLGAYTNSLKVSLPKDFLTKYPAYNHLSAYIATNAKDGKKTFTEEFCQDFIEYRRKAIQDKKKKDRVKSDKARIKSIKDFERKRRRDAKENRERVENTVREAKYHLNIASLIIQEEKESLKEMDDYITSQVIDLKIESEKDLIKQSLNSLLLV